MGLSQIIFTIVCMLLIIYGLVSIFSPKTAWKLSLGWQLKDAEPSNSALIANQIGGVFMIVAGPIMIYLVINNIL
ncbi:DUF6199 family natural product biosynthesis protein [Oceanobacillus locisalsi]|uniref:DUF6199 family natural product biosynthesis protein n=1 Tax=Oceanobacillus locisalsi TaxID=546107 RepID=A0ABW3NMZ1_9BACI